MNPVLVLLAFLLVSAVVLYGLGCHRSGPRVTRILFTNTNGEIIMTLAIPANGATRVGVLYFDQFDRRMDPPAADLISAEENDPDDILSAAVIEDAGRTLRLDAQGAGSASVAVLADGVAGTLFLAAQNPVLTAIRFDEGGASFPTSAL